MRPLPTTVPIRTEEDVLVARSRGRRLAEALGMNSIDLTLLATAISEVARNILVYAGSGEIALCVVDGPSGPGVEVVARDRGPGIADLSLAMQDGWTSGDGLGLGLPGTRRLMDEFAIASEVGVGTTVTLRKWVEP